MIGLVGAQGTGKTTLARAFAEEQKMPFVETTTTAIYKAIGFDPAVDYDITTRVAIQTVILGEFTKQYEAACKASKVWIADRTPIDMAAYMLADVQRTSCIDQPGVSEAIVEYVDQCMKLSNRFFSVLVLLQPGIKTDVLREGKAPAIPAYQEHFNHLAFGLLMDDRLQQRHFFIKKQYTDLGERKASLLSAVAQSVQAFRELQATTPMTAH